MSNVFSPSRKKNQSRRKPRHARVESLERRRLLAADAMETCPADSSPAEVSSLVIANDSESDQIAFQRIVNGTQTSGHESVGIVNGGCTGTLIAPNAVLTAAHCVGGRNETFEIGGRTYSVEKSIVHPDYQSRDIDLAVMILSENVEGITPSEINRTAPEVGQMLTLVGFGGQGTPTGGHDGSFGTKNVGTTPIDQVTETSIEWDYDDPSEANTAPGDSGGPAFVELDGKLVIAGVTSGGFQENAGLGDHSFDTRVDTFASWIDGVVSGEITDGGNNGGNNGGGVPGGGDDGFDGGFSGLDNATAEELARDELDWLDTNQDGNVSRAEMIAGYTEAGDTPGEAADFANYLITEFDADGNGSLDLQELIASYGPANNLNDEIDPISNDADPWDEGGGDNFGGELSPEELAQDELANHDTNGDGVIDRDELVAELTSAGASSTEASEDADWLMADFDANQDGVLDLAELIVSWGGDVGDDPVTEVGDDLGGDDFSEDDGLLNDDVFDDDIGDEMFNDELMEEDGLTDGGDFDDQDDFDEHYGCDVNQDGTVSPMDALLLINQLSNQLISMLESTQFDLFDVNDDGNITPMDALSVINRLSEQARSHNAVSGNRMSNQLEMDDVENDVYVDAAFASYGKLS